MLSCAICMIFVGDILEAVPFFLPQSYNHRCCFWLFVAFYLYFTKNIFSIFCQVQNFVQAFLNLYLWMDNLSYEQAALIFPHLIPTLLVSSVILSLLRHQQCIKTQLTFAALHILIWLKPFNDTFLLVQCQCTDSRLVVILFQFTITSHLIRTFLFFL